MNNSESKTTLISVLPSGWKRWLLRLPIVLYRFHLGGLLGQRLMLLNHVGRKTGQVHQTVVEVAKHDAESDSYYIASGWGYQSNWYQNLVTTPTISIQVGWRKMTVTAETLPEAAGAQILLDYRQHHPLAARELSRLMGLNIMEAPAATLEQIVHDSLPIMRLHPQDAR